MEKIALVSPKEGVKGKIGFGAPGATGQDVAVLLKVAVIEAVEANESVCWPWLGLEWHGWYAASPPSFQRLPTVCSGRPPGFPSSVAALG